MSENYKDVVFYPAIQKSKERGFAIVEGMVGTFIEGADGKMRPALCGGRDTGMVKKAGPRLCDPTKWISQLQIHAT